MAVRQRRHAAAALVDAGAILLALIAVSQLALLLCAINAVQNIRPMVLGLCFANNTSQSHLTKRGASLVQVPLAVAADTATVRTN